MKTGLIIKAISGFYYCQSEGKIYECRGRGVFRNENITPLVGDNAVFEVEELSKENDPPAGEAQADKESHSHEMGGFPIAGPIVEAMAVSGGFVTEIIERRNEFTRPPIANLDKLFIVVAVAQPSPSPLVIDKLITVCEYKEIEPVIVITKTDLGDGEELREIYGRAGYRVICLSNLAVAGEREAVQESGFLEIREALAGCVSAFAGNTGVGKSSLLNNIYPELHLETAHISKKLGRGRHTTRHVELFPIDGQKGYVADTPGFGTMDMARYEQIHKDQLQYCFREFAPYLNHCKFTGCSHTTEKGCAVLEALHEGKISVSRHESYVALYDEAKQIKDWERNPEKK